MKKNTDLRNLIILTAVGVGLAVGAAPAGGQTVVFVDAAATGAGDGSSWDDAYTSVQPALDAATNGQQVWVAAGRYVGTITLKKGVGLYGGFAGGEDPATFDLADRDFAANETILDGNQAGSVVTGPSGATASTRIDGFTITNGIGTASGSSRSGGGVYLSSSSPTIANNRITGNSARGGGGLYLYSSSSTIANNTITGNSGGGLYLSYSSPMIVSNTITRNIASDGGGLHLRDSSSATIMNNRITGNVAVGSGWGGGLRLGNSSSPLIANNLIAGNSAGEGGGVHMDTNSSPVIVNNTITGNGAGNGGGLYFWGGSPTIANTIVAFNSSGIHRQSSGTATLRHNCVYGNEGHDYSGIADPTGTDGNVSADPQLADGTYGDGHIQPDSPCVDAGSNGWAQGEADIDGQPRIQPPGGMIDVGADESAGTIWPTGPYVIVRVSPDGDDGHDGSSWELAKRSVQAGIDAAAKLGGEVWVEAATYGERITLHSYVYLYGGFGGDELQRDERDYDANVTILDGQQQGSVVTAQVGWRTGALDGFTITNGTGTLSGSYRYGGGVYVLASSPTIANNTITGNSAAGAEGGNSGGGLYLNYSSAVIVGNTIADNHATGANGLGGGLYSASSSPMISGNAVRNNSAADGGGGLYLPGSSATIVGNTIADNRAASGAGLFLSFGSPTITDNVITGNIASGGGGGLCVYNWSAPLIANNTFTQNQASSGGGLYLPAANATVTNTTIAVNNASYGGGVYIGLGSMVITNTIVAFNNKSGVVKSGNGTLTLRHNCVYGNTRYNYENVADPTGTGGNISANPQFVQYSGDWHLLAISPAVDVGSNGYAEGDVDVDGGARVVDGDEDGLAVVDMGAYEYFWAGLPCDLDSDGEVNGLDYAAFRAAFGRSVGQAGYNARCDYDGSGTVGLKDYQAWLGCYREFIGNPLAGPPPLPVPVPTPTPGPGPGPQPVTDVGGDVREGAAQSPVRGGMGRP